MHSVDVELVVREDNVVHSYCACQVPEVGEVLRVYKEEKDGTDKVYSYKILSREWASRPWYDLGCILYVEELPNATVQS